MRWDIAWTRTRRSIPHMRLAACPSRIFRSRFRPCRPSAKLAARRSSAEFEDADADFVFAARSAGTDAEHFADGRLCWIARLSRNYRHRCERTVSGDLPGVALPCHFSRRLWRASRERPCPREPITLPPPAARQLQRAISTSRTPGPGFREGDSSYNALQVDVNHRFSNGLSLRGVYTWSKALDDGDSVNGTTANNAPGTGFESVQSARGLGPGDFQRPAM